MIMKIKNLWKSVGYKRSGPGGKGPTRRRRRRTLELALIFFNSAGCWLKINRRLLLIINIIRMGSEEENAEFYLRYYVGHKGKFGHEFLEFEFRPDGKLRYANNSNYKNDTIIRKEVYLTPAVLRECRRIISDSEVFFSILFTNPNPNFTPFSFSFLLLITTLFNRL